ncbi:type-IV secretion system protein TraC [Burkholderia sp. Bp9017]|uniref:TraC family protein n=1 Tax=Burkholderia TaxID=32008 RepID=UPI000F5E8AF8|nr:MULTISPECIES: TraC family protein [Burkholderia]RQZ31612.1 type-IV secretion system protein TraC [Burkholderia sp. Bp9017]RQZ37743.1 type-IV secretion system protein TraC [Burkholderia sp. Bp9016]
MGVTEKIQAMMERQKPSDLLLPMASNDGIYFLDDGRIGMLMEYVPLAGANERTQEMLTNLINQAYLPGTMIQTIKMGVPDLNEALENFYVSRERPDNPAPEVARELCARRIDFIKEASNHPVRPRINDALTLDLRHYVSIAQPFSGVPYPTDQEIEDFKDLRERFRGSLEAAGMPSAIAEAREFLAVMRRYFDIFGDWDKHYDENEVLREQIVPPRTRIVPSRKQIRISIPGKRHQYVKQIAMNRYPENVNLGLMDMFAGDLTGLGTQIGIPFVLTTTIHIPDQSPAINGFRSKHALINNQAFGPMLRWVPILAAKKKGHDVLGAALDRRQQIVQASTVLMLYGHSPRELERRAATIMTYYNSLQAQAYGEQYLTLPTYVNQLPLHASTESIKNTRRFRTMAAEHAAQLLPILADWQGYGDGFFLHTRRMALFFYDFFSRFNPNFNWLLFAESGAGKSFAAQRIIQDYLARGAKIWIVDKGKSHTKLTIVNGGIVISFNRDSKICLNPFTKVIEIEEDIGMLTAMISKMVAPRSKLEDREEAMIMQAIQSVWTNLSSDMTPHDVYAWLLNQRESELAVDLANRLFPFSRLGPYGSWFNGRNNLDADAPIVTLELKDLEDNEILQEVVLLQVMITVQQGMFKGDDSREKMMIAEECGDLFKQYYFSKFAAELNAKIRKHRGSLGLIFQNLAQLYNSAFGEEIAASAATKLIMQQQPESIELTRTKRWIDLPDAVFDLLKSVSTVKGPQGYSEIAFHTPNGFGIARLIDSRFNQVLFSTEGAERTEILAACERGENVVEAIEEFIAERG